MYLYLETYLILLTGLEKQRLQRAITVSNFTSLILMLACIHEGFVSVKKENLKFTDSMSHIHSQYCIHFIIDQFQTIKMRKIQKVLSELLYWTFSL